MNNTQIDCPHFVYDQRYSMRTYKYKVDAVNNYKTRVKELSSTHNTDIILLGVVLKEMCDGVEYE